jgi:hypothetical protein
MLSPCLASLASSSHCPLFFRFSYHLFIEVQGPGTGWLPKLMTYASRIYTFAGEILSGWNEPHIYCNLNVQML